MPTVPDIHRRGTRAAQATIAAPPLTVGTLYFVTDEGLTERWDGSVWQSYSGPGTGSAPTAHAASHQNGGTDEISVVGLSGLLADPQTPLAHAAAHASAGADPVTVTTLAGFPGGSTTFLRADGTFAAASGGTPGAHAASHASAGADPVTVTALAGFPGGTTDFLRADGTFAAASGGTPSAHHASHETGGADAITALAATVLTTGTIASARLATQQKTRAITVVFGTGSAVITAGLKTYVSCPYTGTITGARLLAVDASVTSGSIVIDVWKDTYTAFPPTVADTITASAKPTLSSATKSDDTTLTGWTTAVTAGDVFGFNVDSASLVTQVALQVTLVVS